MKARPKYGGKARKKRPPPSYPTLPVRMTDEEELALAVVLWKSLRCHELLTTTGRTGGNGYPTDDSEDRGDLALTLAKRAGVGAEYLDLTFRLRLVKVTLTPME